VNHASPGVIDDRVINSKDPDQHQIEQNYNLCLNSAAAIGCQVFHIKLSDLMQGKVRIS